MKFKVKKSKCPYCTYICDGALPADNDCKPSPGDISFCLMCCNSNTWDDNMKLIKFDLNSISDLVERNRLKIIGVRMNEFWDKSPDKHNIREIYLKKMDQKIITQHKGKIMKITREDFETKYPFLKKLDGSDIKGLTMIIMMGLLDAAYGEKGEARKMEIFLDDLKEMID